MQTEESCLSTRGPQNLVLIWPSLAVTAAIGMLADAQRARAETLLQLHAQERGLAHARNDQVAESP